MNNEHTVTVYIANLGAYNRGYLIGKHITLPIDGDKLKEEIKNILNGKEAIDSRDFKGMVDEEYAIHDYETNLNINIGEYTNLWKLNEDLQELEALSEDDMDKVIAILDAGLDDDLMNIINEIDDYYIHSDVHSDSDLGHYYLDDENIPEYVTRYIDFEAYGRDSKVNDLGEFTNYGYVKKMY